MDEIQKEKKYHDKINRTLYIYSELLQGNVVEKSKLAEYTGVSEKSIQRDFEDIRNFLQEGETKHQLKYDCHENGYRLDKTAQLMLSTDEVLAVSKILLESRAFSKKR